MRALNRTWPEARGAGAILELVRAHPGITRTELADETGLSRSTVAQRLEQLLATGLISDTEGASTGGRRPALYAFNSKAGVVLAAGLGATRSRLAVTDLAGMRLADAVTDIDIALGPETFLDWIEEQFTQLLTAAGADRSAVKGIGVGIPAPVEWATGIPVLPPIMPGWDGYSIRERLARSYDVPIFIDNDVNVMALGEQRTYYRDIPNLLFLKLGTGIGCGIIADGNVYRGADGSAGDLGHVHTAPADGVLCRCGKFGCLEAIAGGGAIARRLREHGEDAEIARDVVQLVRSGNMPAIELVRESGRLIGEALAGAVNLLNPRVIVIGGDLAHVDEHLMPGLRELVYQRSISLSTQSLRIVRSRLNDHAEVAGAALMVIDEILAPARVDQLVASKPATAA